MDKGISRDGQASSALPRLAQAVEQIARFDGDHVTAIPALSLHRRSSPTEPLHCVYGLGLGVIIQGSKQVLLGSDVINYAPGQSMLTTIDSPVIAHVAKASQREPFLGLFLTLDSRVITQAASELELSRRPRERALRSISVEASDAPLIDAWVRLVENERPSCTRSTAKVIGRLTSPGRRK